MTTPLLGPLLRGLPPAVLAEAVARGQVEEIGGVLWPRVSGAAQCASGFETGVNGNTISTADAGNPTAWNTVTIGATAAAVYDNTHVHTGSLAAKLTSGGTGQTAELLWVAALGTQTDHFGRGYIYLPAYPAVRSTFMRALSGGTGAASISITPAGLIQLRDSVGAILGTSTTAVPLNALARIEFHFVHNTTTGSIEVKLFVGSDVDKAAATETVTGTGGNTLASADRVGFGVVGNNSACTIWFDDPVAGAASYPGATPPVNTVAPAVTGTPTVGQTLTCSNGTWQANPQFSRQWQRDNSGGGVYSNIASATSTTYVLTDTDDGCHVRCVVTGTNGGGSVAANSNAVSVVEPVPANTVAPVISGTLIVGQTLSATIGTWSNMAGYNPSYGYQWQLSANGVSGWGNIAAATSSSYVLTSGEVTKYVRCVVTATNTGGAVAVNSNVLGAVHYAYPSFTTEIAFSGNLSPAYSDFAIGYRPVLYLRLAESAGATATDSSGFANNGTYVNTPTLSQTGPITGEPLDKAVLFNGVDERIEVPDADSLHLGSQFTVVFWWKLTSLPTTDEFVPISKYNGTTGWYLRFHKRDRALILKNPQFVGGSGTYGNKDPVYSIKNVITDTTTWHHIALVQNGVLSAIYVDGQNVTDGAFDSKVDNTTTPLVIGDSRAATTTPCPGYFDEVAVYQKPLSGEKIQVLYQARASLPVASFTWTDVSAYHTEIHTKVGRQYELDRIEAGEESCTLENTDRRFDPAYTSGPYYPNVTPRRRIRHKVTYAGTTYNLFDGQISRWPPAWESPSWSTSTVQAVDSFGLLAQANLPAATYPAEKTGLRIARCLDEIGWSQSLRSIDTGISPLQSYTVAVNSNTSALSHIQDVVDDERGLFFISGSGVATFYDRHRHWKPPYTTSVATFGDGASQIPYEDVSPGYDDSLFWTGFRVTRTGGAPQIYENATARAQYGLSVKTRDDSLVTTDVEAYAQAQWLSFIYSAFYLRVEQIEVDLEAIQGSTPDPFPSILALVLGDRVTVQKTPPGGGSAISGDFFVEGIEHDIGPSTEWKVRLRLSPVPSLAVMILDDSVAGKLDSGALAY